MKKLGLFLGALVLAALVVPASAGWVDMTTSWNAQGVGNGWGMVSDPTTGTLYAFSGADAKVYNKATDTWMALTSAGKGVFSQGDNATKVEYVNGQLIFRMHMANYISIYDIATDTWTQPDIYLDGHTHNWSQGSVYNPVTDKFWAFYTDAGAGTDYSVSLDMATNTWGSTAVYPVSAFDKFPFYNQGVTIGNTYYKLNGMNNYATMLATPFDWGDDPTAATNTAVGGAHDFGGDLGGGNSWGVRQLAADGTDIYVISVWNGGSTLQDDLGGEYGDYNTPPPASPDGYASVWGWVYLPGSTYDRGDGWALVWTYKTYNSLPFAVFDTVTETWTNLDMLYTGNDGSYRNASLAVADGVVYYQINGQFFAYAIPEPATMALLGLGGIGLLARRRRK